MTNDPELFDDLPPPKKVQGETVHGTWRVLRQTKFALGVSRDDSANRKAPNLRWLAKSEITYDLRGEYATITMPKWMAEQEGLTP